MQLQGYMVEVEFDGETLTARGTNKAAQIALRGQERNEGDVVVPVSEIDNVEHKSPSLLTNGNVIVTTTGGKKYQLHYRKKQSVDFAALADALRERVAARP